MPDTDDSAELTVYTTLLCPYCLRLKHGLRRHGITFREVEIAIERAAADFVASVNNGKHTIPTVVYSDGSVATNPSIREVLDKLLALETAALNAERLSAEPVQRALDDGIQDSRSSAIVVDKEVS